VAVLLSPVIAGSAATQKATDFGTPEVASSRPSPIGTDTVGVYMAPAVWFLNDLNQPGPADMTFNYGPDAAKKWLPVRGDWNGDGMDSQGLYDPTTSSFFLKDVCEPGDADYAFGFGNPAVRMLPIVGDWNNDRIDTIGLYDPATSTFYLKDANTPGPADYVFVFGAADKGLMPLAGDWDGDGVDTIGLYNPVTGAFFLKNASSGGEADLAFNFGPAVANPAGNYGLVAVAGDWDGDAYDTIGIYDRVNSVFFLRNRNDAGPADLWFSFGPPAQTPSGRHACLPVVGDWNGL
jgi:hypothetical protein